eukprot:136699_1
MTSVRGLLVVFITSLTCNLTKSLNHKTLPEQKCDNEQSKCSAKPIKSIQITDSYVLDMMEYGAKLELSLKNIAIPIVKYTATITSNDLIQKFGIDSLNELMQIIEAAADPSATSITQTVKNDEDQVVISYAIRYVGFNRNFKIVFDINEINEKEQLNLIAELFSKVHQLEATVNKMENKMSKRASRPFAIVNYLPDSALVASNSHNNDHLPIYGRIGSTHIPGKSHAWCIKAMGDYLTIDLQKVFGIASIMTQGRGDSPQWVAKFGAMTSKDGNNWDNHGVFDGNVDQHSTVNSYLKEGVSCRFVKITPTNCHSHCSMRFDVWVYEKW